MNLYSLSSMFLRVSGNTEQAESLAVPSWLLIVLMSVNENSIQCIANDFA